jgi:hypothetical protein
MALRRERRDFCYVCNGVAAELDHFPVPASLGGIEKVPICRGCHDEKDRFLFEQWDATEAFNAMRGLWEQATRRERLLLCKLIVITARSVARVREMQP